MDSDPLISATALHGALTSTAIAVKVSEHLLLLLRLIFISYYYSQKLN